MVVLKAILSEFVPPEIHTEPRTKVGKPKSRTKYTGLTFPVTTKKQDGAPPGARKVQRSLSNEPKEHTGDLTILIFPGRAPTISSYQGQEARILEWDTFIEN